MTRDFFRNSGDEIRIIGRFFSVLLLDKKQSAISQAHQAAGFDSPTHALPVRVLMQGIRKVKGTRQVG